MEWMNIIEVVSGFLAGGGMSLLFFKATRRKMDSEADRAAAEADTKEWELEDRRIRNLHESLMTNNDTIARLTATVDSLTARLSTLNATIDSQIDRNREISDRLYERERELNYYMLWRCERTVCKDPRGRLPPNDRLQHMQFKKTEKQIKTEL